jgi:hypothetical protein
MMVFYLAVLISSLKKFLKVIKEADFFFSFKEALVKNSSYLLTIFSVKNYFREISSPTKLLSTGTKTGT